MLPLFADRMATSAAVSPDLRARYRLEAQMAAAADLAAERALRSLLAALSQGCVITNDPVAAHVDEHFAFMFVPDRPAAVLTKRSSSANPIATSSSTMADPSISEARLRTRSLSASTPIQEALERMRL